MRQHAFFQQNNVLMQYFTCYAKSSFKTKLYKMCTNKELGIRMGLKSLTKEELEIVRQSMQCVANGNVILHDVEFQTIMGVDVDEFLDIFEAWPNLDENDVNVRTAINNTLNNLIGYPHDLQESWNEVMETPLSEVARVFQKWKGSDINSYIDGRE